MSWIDALRDAFTFFVALVTIVGAATGIGFWVGKLTTRQSHTESKFEALENNITNLLENIRIYANN